MKIAEIKTWDADLGNRRPYTIAFKSIDEVRNGFVALTLDNGITGIGAGNPSEYVTGESYDSFASTLSDQHLDFLVGRDIREVNQLLDDVCVRFPDNPAVRAAVDLALHDAFTRYPDISLVKFLGQKIESLPTSVTIGIKSVEETLAEAEEYLTAGFTVLKVKLGKNLEEDLERLIKLREVYGHGVAIRIDANQGYTVEQTITFFRKTAHLNLELIEQPLPAHDIEGLRSLPQEIKDKLAVDESLLSPADALTLLAPPGAGRIFNIKLMKCGGVAQALKIADIAHHKGIDLFWGCNDESIISISAALHAAFSCSHTKYIDLDGSFDLLHDVVSGGFILKDGRMYCMDKPGLGVERI